MFSFLFYIFQVCTNHKIHLGSSDKISLTRSCGKQNSVYPVKWFFFIFWNLFRCNILRTIKLYFLNNQFVNLFTDLVDNPCYCSHKAMHKQSSHSNDHYDLKLIKMFCCKNNLLFLRRLNFLVNIINSSKRSL